MTLAILIGTAILLSAGYILRRQDLDAREFRAGRIRLAGAKCPPPKKAGSNRSMTKH
jgi:hypothetical protein